MKLFILFAIFTIVYTGVLFTTKINAESDCILDRNQDGITSKIEQSDLDCDGSISILDGAIWAQFYSQQVPSAPTETETWTITPEPTSSETPTPSLTSTPENTVTNTPMPTLTMTASATFVPTMTLTPTPTNTAVPTNTRTNTATATNTASFTATAVPTATATPTQIVGARDKFKQPFASTSIWNMPIGSNAIYVSANIASVDHGTFAEEAIIINRPTLALQTIYHSTLHPNNWNSGTRCNQASSAFTAPVPLDFFIPDNGGDHGGTPNHPSGILTADGNSYTESQPLTHCPGKPYTTGYVNGTYSIYGDGRFGSQGGSHMSGVGGVIRVGEWATARQRGYFNHALKTVLDSGPNFGTTAGPDCNIPGCRWPASGSDCGNTACGYGGGSAHSKVKMGTLLAIMPSYNCAGLRTEPGRIYCNTAKNYGIYIVDSGWQTYYIPIEYSPDGSSSVEFQQQFGIALDQASTTAPWPADVRDIFANAQVVDNNGPTNIGGGGTPRVPLSPPIGN